MSGPYTVTTQPGGYPPQAPGPMYPSPGMPGDGYMGSGAPGQPGFAQPMYPQPGMYGATGQPIAMQPIPGGKDVQGIMLFIIIIFVLMAAL